MTLFRVPSAAFVVLLVPTLAIRAADEPIRLQEPFAAGYQYHVSSRVDLSGSLSAPAKAASKPLTISGDSAIEYDERVLAVSSSGEVEKTARVYRRIEFQRKVADKPQQNSLRPGVRRLVVLRLKNAEVPFSPDGPLLWGEIDLVRTDVFTPALAGLLPTNPVRTGDRWAASAAAVQELTDLEKVEEGRVECRLVEVTTIERRRHARVAFAGTVRGVNEDGPNRQQLDGYFFFDLESNHVSYLSLKGTSFLLEKDGKEVGRVEGRFTLSRQVQQRCPELADEALRGVKLEPDAENTQLLYDNPELGLRFLYPRRWRVGSVQGRRLTLDEPNGNGLALTVEPLAQVPTGAQFLNESRDWLVQQKAKILRADPPQRVQGGARELEHFALEAEMGNDKVVLDYFIVRQPAGGAILSARLLPADLAALQKEVERVARSVTISAPGKK